MRMGRGMRELYKGRVTLSGREIRLLNVVWFKWKEGNIERKSFSVWLSGKGDK